MSEQPVRAATDPAPYGWRAGAARVLANALLVLLAFEVVSIVVGVAGMIVTGTPAMPPVEFVLIAAAFLLIRWIYALPGLLLVLVGIEYVARRAPHARVLTAIVAFAPMVLWELLSKSPGAFPVGAGCDPRRDRRAVRGRRASAGPLPGALDGGSWGRATPSRVGDRPSMTRISPTTRRALESVGPCLRREFDESAGRADHHRTGSCRLAVRR